MGILPYKWHCRLPSSNMAQHGTHANKAAEALGRCMLEPSYDETLCEELCPQHEDQPNYS